MDVEFLDQLPTLLLTICIRCFSAAHPLALVSPLMNLPPREAALHRLFGGVESDLNILTIITF